MKSSIFFLVCALASSCAWGQSADHLAVAGYVTRVASSTDFDVNGIRILCGDATQTRELNGSGMLRAGCPSESPFIGESIRIKGVLNKVENTALAAQIQEMPPEMGEVSGTAVIDAQPARNPNSPGTLLVRADGYRIEINGKTQVTWTAPLNTLADVKAGDWIEFKGFRNTDGTVQATSAKLGHDVVSESEAKLRKKNDFDPFAAHPKTKLRYGQAKTNPRVMPLYNDPAMLSRVTAIGERLIPAYQRALSAKDPVKINFRFQVVENRAARDALSLPSGIILVPRQVVERMQNDSQLATVLADNIACVIEKQFQRVISSDEKIVPVVLAAAVAGGFVPGVDIAGLVADYAIDKAILTRMQNQSGRVSLALLRDAGYDIEQAPRAWWLLAAKDAKPLTEIPIPHRAEYLYRMLGEEWRNGPVNPAVN